MIIPAHDSTQKTVITFYDPTLWMVLPAHDSALYYSSPWVPQTMSLWFRQSVIPTVHNFAWPIMILMSVVYSWRFSYNWPYPWVHQYTVNVWLQLTHIPWFPYNLLNLHILGRYLIANQWDSHSTRLTLNMILYVSMYMCFGDFEDLQTFRQRCGGPYSWHSQSIIRSFKVTTS